MTSSHNYSTSMPVSQKAADDQNIAGLEQVFRSDLLPAPQDIAVSPRIWLVAFANYGKDDVGSATFSTLMILAAKYADYDTGKKAWPGIEKLAKERGKSGRTIQRHLEQGEKAGWIQQNARGHFDCGKAYASEYWLTLPDSIRDLHVPPAQGSTGHSEGGLPDTSDTPTGHKTQESVHPPSYTPSRVHDHESAPAANAGAAMIHAEDYTWDHCLKDLNAWIREWWPQAKLLDKHYSLKQLQSYNLSATNMDDAITDWANNVLNQDAEIPNPAGYLLKSLPSIVKRFKGDTVAPKAVALRTCDRCGTTSPAIDFGGFTSCPPCIEKLKGH